MYNWIASAKNLGLTVSWDCIDVETLDMLALIHAELSSIEEAKSKSTAKTNRPRPRGYNGR